MRGMQKRRYEKRDYGHVHPTGQSGADYERRRAPASLMQSEMLSAVRANNLNFLRKELGDVLLEKRTGMMLNRLRELCDGRGFDDGVAFHLESELGLPSGFFDRLNPQLSQEVLARLKSLQEEGPLDETSISTTPTSVLEADEPFTASVENTSSRTVLHLTGGPMLGKMKRLDTEDKKMDTLEPTATATKKIGRPARTPREEVDISSAPAAEQARLSNFQMLLSAHGAKSRLAKLMNCSPSVISLLLTPKPGRSVFSREYANRVTNALGLPLGWLDERHELTEVPEQVLQLLRGEVSEKPDTAQTVKAVQAAIARPEASISLAPVRNVQTPAVEYRRKRHIEKPQSSAALAPAVGQPAPPKEEALATAPAAAAEETRLKLDLSPLATVPNPFTAPATANKPEEAAGEQTQHVLDHQRGGEAQTPSVDLGATAAPDFVMTSAPTGFSELPKSLLEPFDAEAAKVPALAEALLRIIVVKAQQGKLSDKLLSELLLRVAIA
jgi:hypothetical protein